MLCSVLSLPLGAISWSQVPLLVQSVLVGLAVAAAVAVVVTVAVVAVALVATVGPAVIAVAAVAVVASGVAAGMIHYMLNGGNSPGGDVPSSATSPEKPPETSDVPSPEIPVVPPPDVSEEAMNENSDVSEKGYCLLISATGNAPGYDFELSFFIDGKPDSASLFISESDINSFETRLREEIGSWLNRHPEESESWVLLLKQSPYGRGVVDRIKRLMYGETHERKRVVHFREISEKPSYAKPYVKPE